MQQSQKLKQIGMKKKSIELYNRYHSKLWLEFIEDNKWVLKGDNDAMDYYRVGYEHDNKSIRFIDPSGGPFLSVGTIVNGKKITSIERGTSDYIFILEDESKED